MVERVDNRGGFAPNRCSQLSEIPAKSDARKISWSQR